MPSTTATTATAAPSAGDSTKVQDVLAQRFAENVTLVRKSVENNDDSYVQRALRRTTWIRRQKPAQARAHFIRLLASVPIVAESVAALFPETAMEVEGATTVEEKKTEDQPLLPEIELYLHHTAVHMAKSNKTCSPQTILASARLMMDRANKNERRTMDVLRARAWHTFAMVVELANGKLDDKLRDEILAAHRLACLRLDESGQAVAINLILRDLVSRNLVSEAAKFATKARFPDRVSNSMQVRHLYYMARVEALQLEYGKSLNLVQQAIRKTPATCGRGFRLKLHELGTVVSLLTGEIPERAWFSDNELGDALEPYFDLVKAVRVGHVHAFEQCITAHATRYEKDHMMTLIQRLHSSVIKTGLKAIGAAYSKISFADIAAKLALAGEDANSTEAAFFLCAKAIRDGVLDATIDSDGKVLCSSDEADVYSSTSDPQRAYQRRINFLQQVHNDAVKALRYPPDAHKTQHRQAAPEITDETEIDELEAELEEE